MSCFSGRNEEQYRPITSDFERQENQQLHLETSQQSWESKLICVLFKEFMFSSAYFWIDEYQYHSLKSKIQANI